MSASTASPIAIVGVGCRFPGGVDSSTGLWNLLVDRRHTAGPVPADRWDATALAAYSNPEDAQRAGHGCFLDGDMWAWDPEALSVAPAEQRWVDPQFRLLMEVAWEAVEHAGIPIDRIRGSRTGVYMGTYAPDNLFREARPVQDAPNSPYLFGNFTAGAAGRVAFALDLRGPVMVISTHCSSGLVALDSACGALTLEECDTALAGGVLLMLSPETQHYEAPLLLSSRGACHAFDARADGYVRGEGAGVLVLKRLADARRHGDRVLAVIRGSAVNNDGQASRLTAPSTRMQQELFSRAVANAGVDAGQVGLVEAHGPGTAVGDPVEYASINAVYGQGRGRCALGSIKTNIGHSEPVSGIAGVIKAVECLSRGMIPPNLHFQRWNPSIGREEGSRLFVPTDPIEWPVPDGPRLAAVCSYGVTGTNAHVVLESAPSVPRRHIAVHPERNGRRPLRVFAVSGNSPRSLELAAARLATWAETDGRHTDMADVAHTLLLRRSHADHRLCVLARNHHELAARARCFADHTESEGLVSDVVTLPPDHAGPVFVFTGQGSQRPGMCQGLLAGEPAFRSVIAEIEPLIAAEAGFSVREMLTHPSRLVGVDRIQPTLFAVQVALAALWRSWGIEPAAVIGQSLGEVAASVVAGGLSMADGTKVICRRSRLLATISGGAMASVLLDAKAVWATIEAAGADGVSLAVLTSPASTVISGDAGQIAGLVADWAAAGVVAKMIDVDVASHSPQVDPVIDRLRAALVDIPPTEPEIPFYSTVSEDPCRPGAMDHDYWVRNQRDPVRFHVAVSAALARGHRLFLECTPHPLAVRPVVDTAHQAGVRDVVAVGTLRQGINDQEAFLGHLGAVYCAGYDRIDWGRHYRDGRLVDAPGTAWNRTRHGGEDQPYRLVAPGLVGAHQHPLLGGHVLDPATPDRHLWQTPISPARLPWLDDHRVADVPVLPGAGVVEMLLAAATQVFGTDQVSATDVQIRSPLVLAPEPLVTTSLSRGEGGMSVEILSWTAEGVTVHATGTVHVLDREHDDDRIEPATTGWHDSPPDDLYRHFRERHNIYHGPAFAGVERIQIHPDRDEALSRVRIPDSARVSAWMMPLHPVLTDQLVHTVVAVWLAHHVTAPGPVVVTGFEEVRVYGPTAHTRLAHVRLHQADDSSCTASGRLATADGTVVAEVRGLRLTNITPPAERFTSRLSHLRWVPEPVQRAEHTTGTGTWVMVAHQDADWPSQLSAELAKRTDGCRLLQAGDFARLAESVPTSCAGVVLALGGRPDGTAPVTAARAEVARAVTVIRALTDLPTPPRLWLVWRTDGPAPLITAGLRGLVRTIAYEHPELAASSIESTVDTLPQVLVDELLDVGQPITEIALHDTGRHVARVRTGAGTDTAVPATAMSSIRPGASYLVTGGLGGLGLLTVHWLARRGAGRVVINGRTGAPPEVQAQLETLRADGTEITVIIGDIAVPSLAARAVLACTTGGRELCGVLHAAGVVQDATVATLTPELLERVWRGKAHGAWTLHQATIDHALDFFVVYSSMASLVGSPGQSAYATANAFLDGLVRWRLSQELPATGIHWGAWSDVGRGQHLAQRGFATITPADGIDALERILAAGYHQIAYSPLDLDHWIAPYPALRESTLLSCMLTEAQTSVLESSVLDELLSIGNDAARRQVLETLIIDTVRDLLGGTTRHIGPHTSMVLLGLDSLGAVQLQQHLQHSLGIDIKPGVIWVKPDAAGLAAWLLGRLGLSAGPPSDIAPGQAPPSPPAPALTRDTSRPHIAHAQP